MPFRPALLLALCCATTSLPAQQPKPQFEVASIHESRATGRSSSNFPLNPGPQYNNQGGLLMAHNVPILQLLVFAYARNMYQIQSLRQQLPDWARQATFDVQAHADGNPSKDEMRAMTRTLLEDRFHLKLHTETHEVLVVHLVPVHPGKLGPDLRPHPADSRACDTFGPYAGNGPVATVDAGFPAYCGAVIQMPSTQPGLMHLGGRAITMNDIAHAIGGTGNFDRPVLDETGLSGKYDMLLEFAPDDLPGIPLDDALKQQLGLKLQSGKGPVDVYIIDKLDPPTAN